MTILIHSCESARDSLGDSMFATDKWDVSLIEILENQCPKLHQPPRSVLQTPDLQLFLQIEIKIRLASRNRTLGKQSSLLFSFPQQGNVSENALLYLGQL